MKKEPEVQKSIIGYIKMEWEDEEDQGAPFQQGDFLYSIADELLQAFLEESRVDGDVSRLSPCMLMLEDWLSLQVESKSATKRPHLQVKRRNKLRSKLLAEDFQVVTRLLLLRTMESIKARGMSLALAQHILRLLLEYGVDCSMADFEEEGVLTLLTNSLMCCSSACSYRVYDECGDFRLEALRLVQTLMDFGANVEECNADGDSVLDILLREDSSDRTLLQLFLDLGVSINRIHPQTGRIYPLLCLSDASLSKLQVLLQRGVSLQCAHLECKISPLMLAVNLGSLSTVHCLLQESEVLRDIDVQDDTGCTAMTHAIVSHQDEIASLLIEYGASMDIEDNTGFSALDYADSNF